jgi:hypothetical protein
VTRITSERDAGQQRLAAPDGGILRCYLQQRGDADCHTSSDRDKSLIPHWFERWFVLLAQI